MSNLQKHAVVLDALRPDFDGSQGMIFNNMVAVREADGTIRDLESVILTKQVFEDLGSPEQITVVIMPGNVLDE